MKNKALKFSFLAAIATLTACSGGNKKLVTDTAKTAPTKPIIILYDNDVHCETSGYPAIAGLRDAIKASDTAYTALVSSGDFLQGGTIGSISQGEHIVKMLNSSGYDAIGLGNHEFDYRTPRLLELAKQIEPAIVSANFTDMQGKRIFKPYIIKQFGDKKIAFLGIVTTSAMLSESYSFFDEDGNQLYDLHPNDIVKYVQDAVDSARSEGANYVIALSHMGEEPLKGVLTSQDLVAKTTGINVVLDGHSHSTIEQNWVINAKGDSILVTQTGTKFQNIGKLDITPDGKFRTSLVPIENISTISARAKATFDSIQNISSAVLDRKISNTEFALTINDENGKRAIRNQETNLGNLVADALRFTTKAQVSFVNAGGIRAGIEAGDITYRNILDALPYSNDISLLQVTGQQIMDFLEVSSAYTPNEFGGFLQVSGFRYTIDTSITNTITIDTSDYSLKIVGKRRVQNIEIEKRNGSFTPIEPKTNYIVCTSNYLARESSENRVLNKAPFLGEKIMTDTDAFIKYLSEKLEGKIPEQYREKQGRIRIR